MIRPRRYRIKPSAGIRSKWYSGRGRPWDTCGVNRDNLWCEVLVGEGLVECWGIIYNIGMFVFGLNEDKAELLTAPAPCQGGNSRPGHYRIRPARLQLDAWEVELSAPWQQNYRFDGITNRWTVERGLVSPWRIINETSEHVFGRNRNKVHALTSSEH